MLKELESLVQRVRAILPGSAPRTVPNAPSRYLRRRFTAEEIEELVARYTAGEGAPALRRAYGISKSGLRQLLMTEGVLRRRRAITLEVVERVTRLYESGLSIAQVADEVGYSYSTIRELLHENRVAVRTRGFRNRRTTNA
jgi:hypothetical protein